MSCSAAGSAPLLPTAPRNLHRILNAIAATNDQKEKTKRLIRIGNKLNQHTATPTFQPAHRVQQCTSVVHLTCTLDQKGKLQPHGNADSRIAKGMLAILVRGLRDEPPDALWAINEDELALQAGLTGVLSASRINGFAAMLKHMRRQVLLAQNSSTATTATRDDDHGNPRTLATALPDPILSAASTGSWNAAPQEVAVLLSGGVDSSVALRRLVDRGEKVRAFYLRIWLEDEDQHAARGECPWEEDWMYASAVCAQAGVPLEPVSLQSEYSDRVVKYLMLEAASGRTPNPDIMCNSRIKFGAFMDVVGRHFGSVATGHYARTLRVERGCSLPTSGSHARKYAIEDMSSSWARLDSSQGVEKPSSLLGRNFETILRTSADADKDQTYFLSQLSQEQLQRARFPIGELTKPQVRELANRMSLPNRHRRDSQGICFLGRVNYDSFLRDHLGERRGEVIEFETGERVGMHRGLWFHTIGQRRGIGPVLHPKKVALGPWYVVNKNVDENTLFVSRSYQSADKPRNFFEADAINWIACRPPDEGQLTIKVRHGAATHQAHVELMDKGKRARVHLYSRDKGLAPGQFCAFYDGDICLGSGVISSI